MQTSQASLGCSAVHWVSQMHSGCSSVAAEAGSAAMPNIGTVSKTMDNIRQMVPTKRLRFFTCIFFILLSHKIRRPGSRAAERLDKCGKFFRGNIQPTNHADDLCVFQFDFLLFQLSQMGLLGSNLGFDLFDLRHDFL